MTLKGQKSLSEAYPKEINSLGDHLRKRRLDLGYLQREVAAIIGVDETTINNWERQRNHPEIRFIAKIIELLGYDPFPEPASLSERLVFFRTRQGLSQIKFARKLGVDPSTSAGWEVARRSPSRDHLNLLRRLGIVPPPIELRGSMEGVNGRGTTIVPSKEFRDVHLVYLIFGAAIQRQCQRYQASLADSLVR